MPRIKVAVGVSPRNAARYDDAIEESIRQVARDGKLVRAIGSCGLTSQPDDAQRQAFTRQINLAKELRLVLVVEADGAVGEAIALMGECGFPFPAALLRSFDGTVDELREWTERGGFVSFDCRASNDPARFCELAHLVPADRLVLESGAPYRACSFLPGYPARCDQVLFAYDALSPVRTPAQIQQNAVMLFGP